MKLALITGVLFALSYIAVNGGLGPDPLRLLIPLTAGVAMAVATRWQMRRGRRTPPGSPALRTQAVPAAVANADRTRPAPRPPGGKARKLF